MKTLLVYILVFSLCYTNAYCQSIPREVTLDEVINRLSLESSSAKIELLNFQNDLLRYENYKKSFLPAFVLNFKLRGIGFFRTAYYIASILGSSVAIAVLWRALFAIDGLLNSFIGVFGLDPVNWLGEPSLALMSVTLLRVWQFGSAMVIFLEIGRAHV